jgi:hypothetical protein
MVSITNSIQTGLGFSIGFHLAGILFAFIGLIFFIPGFILFKSELKAGRKGSATEIFGIILMIIGGLLMGGFGLAAALSSINDITG